MKKVSTKSKAAEGLLYTVFLLCGVTAVGFVLCISIYLIVSGIPAIREIGLADFLFGDKWQSTAKEPSFGILPFILTSVYGTAGAVVIGVPIGLLTAIYLAKAAPKRIAGVIRGAVQLLAGIPSVVYGLVGMIVLVPAILGSWLLAARLSKRVVKPFNTIDLDHPTENEGYDELSPLLHRISTQQQKLKERKVALAQKQKELDVILENMSEGMLLLQDNGHIISINAAAAGLLETTGDCIGQDILMVSRKPELQEIIDTALGGKKEERVIDLLGGRYQVSYRVRL